MELKLFLFDLIRIIATLTIPGDLRIANISSLSERIKKKLGRRDS